jgi:hypothetical protein
MDERQRTRQQQACHIKFKQLERDGTFPQGVTCYTLATEIAGREIASLKELSDWELNALRDRLEGKPNKMLAKISRLAPEAGIQDLNRWMAQVGATSETLAWMRGHTPETLPLKKQFHLLKILERRAAKRGYVEVQAEA